MHQWSDKDIRNLEQQAKNDPSFQEFQILLHSIDAEYDALLQQLTPVDRELIITHEYYSVELEYQRTRIAYQLGKNIITA